jgi:hypothetical protein
MAQQELAPGSAGGTNLAYKIDSAHLKIIETLHTGRVWSLNVSDRAFFTIGPIAIDWDGCPTGYADVKKHPELKPKDSLGNEGHKGSWWGVVTDTGKKTGTPVEQDGKTAAQPYKGYYISQNILTDSRFKNAADVRRYTDASQVPYVALPNSLQSMKTAGLRTGCYCLLVSIDTMQSCFAVFADSKAATRRMGEISARASELLGTNDGDVYILVLPKSGLGQGIIPDEQAIQTLGRTELKLFSMIDRQDDLLKSVAGIPNLSNAIIRAGYLHLDSTSFVSTDADGADMTTTRVPVAAGHKK